MKTKKTFRRASRPPKSFVFGKKTLKDRVYLFHQSRFLDSSDCLVFHFTALYEKNCGYVAYSETCRKSGAFLDIGFGDNHFAVVFFGEFIDYRSERLAWSAPFGTEIYNCRKPRLHYEFFEIVVCKLYSHFCIFLCVFYKFYDLQSYEKKSKKTLVQNFFFNKKAYRSVEKNGMFFFFIIKSGTCALHTL